MAAVAVVGAGAVVVAVEEAAVAAVGDYFPISHGDHANSNQEVVITGLVPTPRLSATAAGKRTVTVAALTAHQQQL
jgi:hypothetical protein